MHATLCDADQLSLAPNRANVSLHWHVEDSRHPVSHDGIDALTAASKRSRPRTANSSAGITTGKKLSRSAASGTSISTDDGPCPCQRLLRRGDTALHGRIEVAEEIALGLAEPQSPRGEWRDQ
jgi:hypothetical protein